MNYRHHFHAGNFADVFKHATLIQLARAIQRKPAGAFFLDTHAGRGGYDLANAAIGGSRPRLAEHPDGIGRLWPVANLPAPLAEYLALVREYDRSKHGFGVEKPIAGRKVGPAPGGGPGQPGPAVSTFPADGAGLRYYPGSPWFLRRIARAQDRLALCETEVEAVQALKDEFAGVRRAAVHQRDGFGAVSAMLPPPEKRALVLIDPPYEAADEWTKVESALRNGLRRLRSGLFAVWYPLAKRAASEEFLDRVENLHPPPALAMEIVIDPNALGMRGCGILILNPPWGFAAQATAWLPEMAALLARAPGIRAECRWLVSE